MALELGRVAVSSVDFGSETRVTSSHLSIGRDALAHELLEAVQGLASLRLSLARPGDTTRIVGVKDVVEPRVKVSGAQIGAGRVHALSGFAVVTCGRIVGFQEGIIDLHGGGALLSPFSQLALLVLECEPVEGLTRHEHEAAVRRAGLLAAECIARAAVDAEPEQVEVFAHGAEPVAPGLPRVAYVYMLLSQGLLHDTYVFGRNACEGMPRLFDARAVFEGAVVSGNCVSACDKNTTWHHQNNPIVRELFRRHGRDLDFVGTVLTNEPTRLSEKEASARGAVELVQSLDAQAAVLSKEGFGNPDADLMLLIRGLEQAGVATVALTDEFAGADGASPSLADTTPEANALVSVGNANERVVLPPLEHTLGPLDDVTRLAGGHARSLRGDGSIEVELQAIVGSTNQLGQGRLSCRET